ncbi:MAG: DNA alkylation repair protein [Candidatus Methanomethylophilaceae archaeon]|jgi:3-methyladenine DNA glycosylase AlkD
MIDVISELESLADPEYDAFNRKLNPGIGKTYGVRVPQLRALAKRIVKEDDWRSYLGTEPSCFEEQMLHGMIIVTTDIPMDERVGYIREFVPIIDTWAVCDISCGKWKIKKEEKEVLWDYCVEALDSDEEFVMRFAASTMIGNFLDDDHIKDVLELLTSHYNPGYYYRMGAAWCLSFCYIHYPELSEPYIFSDKLDTDIMSRTVSKICDSYRVEKEDKVRLKGLKKEILNRSPRSS